MHVYTLVWQKSDRIGFLIVGLTHLDYSINSCITPACICSIRLDPILRSAQARDFFPGREPEVERRWRLSSKITANKSAIVHLVCVMIMYTIYEMYKDVASPCSSYAIFLKCQGDVKRSAGGSSVTTSWNGYSATYRTRVWHASASNSIFSLACILGQLQLSDWAA